MDEETSGKNHDELPAYRAKRLKGEGWDMLRLAYGVHREFYHDALEKFRAAEKLAREAGAQEILADVLGGMAAALRVSGKRDRTAEAVGYSEEEAGILRTLGRESEALEREVGLLAAYRDLATLAAGEGAAVDCLTKGINLGRKRLDEARTRGDKGLTAAYCNNLADLCTLMSTTDVEMGESHLKTASALYRQAEDLWGDAEPEGRAAARMGLAETYLRLNTNLGAAQDLLEQVQEFYESAGHRVEYQIAQVKSLMAMVHEARGDNEIAKMLRQEAAAIFRRMGFSG